MMIDGLIVNDGIHPVTPLNYIMCADDQAYCCQAFLRFNAFDPDPTKLEVSRLSLSPCFPFRQFKVIGLNPIFQSLESV